MNLPWLQPGWFHLPCPCQPSDMSEYDLSRDDAPGAQRSFQGYIHRFVGKTLVMVRVTKADAHVVLMALGISTRWWCMA